ncbi:MAG: c-type cytochrome domain-containing protein, partial [Bryobacteraceae bacterium]
MRTLIISVSLLVPAFAQMPSGLKNSIDQACLACHSGKAPRGGLDFTSLSFDLGDRATRERWIHIHDRVEKREMPPKGVVLAPADRSAL